MAGVGEKATSPGKVVVAATAKGGAGKTTTVACLACYWAEHRRRVALIDTDPAQTLARWHNKGRDLAAMTLISETDEHAIIPAINRLVADHHVVLVDCAGFSNQAMIFALGRADLVLIPSMTDEANVFEAAKMKRLIDSTAQLTQRDIMVRSILCRVKRSQVAEHSRAQLKQLGVNPLNAQFHDRVAFQEASFYGTSPIALAPTGAAAEDIRSVAAELEPILWPQSAAGGRKTAEKGRKRQ